MKFASRYLLVLLAALVLGVFAAACGDDGADTDTASGEPLSKEEFIAQGDEICESGDAEIERQAEDLGTSADENTLVTTVIVPGTNDQIDQIRELVPPEGDEDEINEFLDTFSRGVDELENDPTLLATPKTIAEARDLAREYGFKACNSGGTASSQPSGVSVGGGPAGGFIAQADQICADTAAQTQRTIKDVIGDGGQPTPAQLEEVAELTASGIEDQVSGIRGLEIPEGDEDEVEAILTAAEQGAEEIRNDPESLTTNGVPNEKLADANDLAVAYGLTVCGS